MNNKWYNSLDTIFLGLFTLIGVAFLIGQPKVYDSSLTGGKLFFVFLTILFCPVYSIILLVFFIKGKRFSRNKMIYNVLITLAILIAGFSIAYSSIDSGAVAYYTTQFHSGWDESFFKEVPVYKNELLGYAIAIIGELTFAWLLFWRKKAKFYKLKDISFHFTFFYFLSCTATLLL